MNSNNKLRKRLKVSAISIMGLMALLSGYIIYFWGLFDWELWRHIDQPEGLIILMVPYVYSSTYDFRAL